MENVKQLMGKRAEYKQELELEKEKYNHLQEKIENVVSIEEFDKIDNEINQTFEEIQKLEKILENFAKNENTIIDQVKKQKDKEYNQETEIINKNINKISKEFLKFIEKVEKITLESEKEIGQIERPLEKEFGMLKAENKISAIAYLRVNEKSVRDVLNDIKHIWRCEFDK